MNKRFTFMAVLLLGLVACKTEVNDPLSQDSSYQSFFDGYISKGNTALDDVHKYLQNEDRKEPFAKVFSENYGHADWNNSIVRSTKTGETNVVIPIVNDAKKEVKAFMAIIINYQGYSKNIVSKEMMASLKNSDVDGYNLVGATFYQFEKLLYSKRAPEDVAKPVSDKQTEGWVEQCTDWYQITEYGCTITYDYIGQDCNQWYEPDPLPPLPPSPEVPPTWNDPSNPSGSPSPQVPSNKVIAPSSTLTQSQIDKLNKVILDIRQRSCLVNTYLSALENSGASFKFSIDPTLKEGRGAYYPGSTTPKAIKFIDESAIKDENVQEELFHAYQDIVFQGGITQYGSNASANIELEAKLLNYISCITSITPACADACNNPEFMDRINNTTNYGERTPTYSEVLGWFNYFLPTFSNDFVGYEKTTFKTGLEPSAIKSILGNIKCY